MLQIKKIDIFIAKQFGLLFVGTFFICQFVLMMQFLWRYVDDLIGKGLSLDVMAQFFFYMALILMPQAMPLAILLSSLITFGNLGESSELTAIKAAGISLMQAFRSLFVIVIFLAGISFFFQNVIGPEANKLFYQLLISMKQKSPELEIPEGVFYDGIPNTNLYVQRKDLKTGKLYGIMIYKINNSYDDAAIIRADSGMLQSTAEKKHLLLTLYSGEWFENMQQQDVAGSASIPYRRETFWKKVIVLDFDGGLNMVEMDFIAADARAKSMKKIVHDLDSIKTYNDSIGRSFYEQAQTFTFYRPKLEKRDSARLQAEIKARTIDIDSMLAKLSPENKQAVMTQALNTVNIQSGDLDMKSDYSFFRNREARMHQMEFINKITLSMACLIFFFIGAPLGAIIRKGGLGIPVIISVIVFIIYYIFENTGMRMAREDNWTVLFGKLLGTAILTPVAIFFTYKANKDSTVFNIDMYRNIIFRIFGIRTKRHIYRKEVIINDPMYAEDVETLRSISDDASSYSKAHHLLKAPNAIKIFFYPGDDHEVENISNKLEAVIEDLSNTRDKIVLNELNNYPLINTNAHTRPFSAKWMNVVTGLIFPVGIFFYFRIWRFRLRLYKDMKVIRQTSDNIIKRIEERKTIFYK